MFSKRSTQDELMDDLSLCSSELRKNLDELEAFNFWFGSKKLLINALNNIYKKYANYLSQHKMVIGDLGCGGGDLLRAIAMWAQSKKVTVELIGVDANPFMIEYAVKKSHLYPNIQYRTLDILAPEMAELQFDIVCINSICHHLSDDKLMLLFKSVAQKTKFAVIINDLHRHWMSYFTIKCIAKIFSFSYLAKHDAPLSVLRAFRKQELIDLFKNINLTSYQIRWVWPFRWEITIWCL